MRAIRWSPRGAWEGGSGRGESCDRRRCAGGLRRPCRCRLNKHRPKRSLGQNFLVAASVQRKIAAACGACEGEQVLEIGPGRGELTRRLAESGARVAAVELDDDLAAGLRAEFRDRPAVTIVHGDVLEEDLPALVGNWSETRVVGNIPYNITTPIVFRLLDPPCPADIVLMVQTEVAQRMLAAPGGKTYGALSVGVALHARVERLFSVPRSAFRPVPKVDSTVVRITPRSPPGPTPSDAARTRRLVRAAFSWRRKQIGTILRSHPDLGLSPGAAISALQALSLDPKSRPEQLSPADFATLSAILPGDGPPSTDDARPRRREPR